MSDPCECFFDHEAAMQRLFALLRNSPSDSSSPLDALGQPPDSLPQTLLWAMVWMILATVMWQMRPESLRSRRQEGEDVPQKPITSNNDNNPPPPPPPSAL